MSGKTRTRYSISVAIPAYNEESNIESVVTETLELLSTLTDRYEVVVTNDASSDRTREILENLQARYPDKVQVIHHTQNVGTNLSLAEMFRKVRYELVFFLPADKQIRCHSIARYVEAVEKGADVVQGWRTKREDPLHRRFFNWLYRACLKLLLGVSYQDASASDLYKKEILDQIEFYSKGRFLQAEIVFKSACLGYNVVEIPVEHFPRTAGKQTGINAKTTWLSFVDLWQVAPRLRQFRNEHSKLQKVRS